tara:strand:+ start:659 stop:898 length:240 start_codon:yes stop_codon:yes gene_type:complete
MENYTAKQFKKMFDEAEAQPYVQHQRNYEQKRMSILSETIKDILYHSQQYNSNDIKEVLEECIEEVNAYNKMVKEPDII